MIQVDLFETRMHSSGCVLSAAVAVSGEGELSARGVSAGGCLPEGCPPRGVSTWEEYTSLPGQNDRCL